MKKILLLSIPAGLIFSVAHAETKSYAALDLKGVCANYETREAIPDGYKEIPSCDLVKTSTSGVSLRDKMRERFKNRYTKKQGAYIKNKKDEVDTDAVFNSLNKTTLRKGSGTLTKRRGAQNRRLTTNKQVSHFARRSKTQRVYSQKTRNFINNQNNKGGHQLVGDTTSAERAKRRAFKPKQMSSTMVKRTGSLSTAPKFSTQAKNRRATHQVSSGTKRWKSASQIKRDEFRAAQKERKLKRLANSSKAPTLRRTWKGDRLTGDLNGSTTDSATSTEETK